MVAEPEVALETLLEAAPKLIRQGMNDFRNSRNFLYCEKWEEFMDGSVCKKIVHDNGFGVKTLKDKGKKLNLDILSESTQIKMNTTSDG